METTIRIHITGPSEYVNKKWWQLQNVINNDKLIKGWLVTEIETLLEKRPVQSIPSIQNSNPVAFIKGQPISSFNVTFVKFK